LTAEGIILTLKIMDLEKVREMLDRRYDELKSGEVKPIDGEEAFALLRKKSQQWSERGNQ